MEATLLIIQTAMSSPRDKLKLEHLLQLPTYADFLTAKDSPHSDQSWKSDPATMKSIEKAIYKWIETKAHPAFKLLVHKDEVYQWIRNYHLIAQGPEYLSYLTATPYTCEPFRSLCSIVIPPPPLFGITDTTVTPRLWTTL